ncbi:M48 family metallopeptidase [Undibacterium fentianense]|uniref:M48 family metallopeptidase n=1 Tax=Undibacterium fentianense TaxID=2828728 RepID=A0A941IDP2_9BURK|nr:M48 family metallopeptidase [Undibacterium fentianense]MBR7801514.1 M48 family metallopeptidase [Undibacterium fentianense]
MNFFEQQAQAHRESKKLLFLFALAVLAIGLAVNGCLALIWIWMKGQSLAGPHSFPRGFFFTNTFVCLLLIGGGTLFEMARLKEGGDAVARMAGGRLISPDSSERQERRLLNIVEEMALASGIACPRVYILDEEDAINAFAAGYHQNQAVVAVTRGSLLRLTRDELQGVIGHEFSHILNGDMRMNIKLIGILFGIQMLAGFGQHMMEWGARMGSSRSRDEKGPSFQLVLLAFGAALFVIGYIGIFFGRLIKSAVSRQREFLADASAVQFTRNPEGIGGALRKIGGLTLRNQCGSRINHPNAEQFSHMFLGAARPNLLSGLFATHPPIKVRLERLYGRRVEFLEASEIEEEAVHAVKVDDSEIAVGLAAGDRASGRVAHVPEVVSVGFHPDFGYRQREPLEINEASSQANRVSQCEKPVNIPAEILQAARDPQAASVLVCALVLDRTLAENYQSQIQILRQFLPQQCAFATLLHETLEKMSPVMRLPVLDLAMPALHLLNSEQRRQMLGLLSRLIAADQQISQSEFVLQTIVQRRLSVNAGRDVKVHYHRLAELKEETALLISLMAGVESDRDLARQAYIRAIASMPELGLQREQFVGRESIDFFVVKQALDKFQQLAPLAKPFLIRLMLKASADPLSLESADLLRCVCAALDAPVPEVVSACYAITLPS